MAQRIKSLFGFYVPELNQLFAHAPGKSKQQWMDQVFEPLPLLEETEEVTDFCLQPGPALALAAI